MTEYRIEFDNAGALLLAIIAIPICIVAAVFADSGQWVFGGCAIAMFLIVVGAIVEDVLRARRKRKAVPHD